MLGWKYKDLEDQEIFDTIEEAILTSCPYCGTELEWTLTVKWNNRKEIPEIHATAFSCGVSFLITPTEDGYMTEEKPK